jgi:hypothetical protein
MIAAETEIHAALKANAFTATHLIVRKNVVGHAASCVAQRLAVQRCAAKPAPRLYTMSVRRPHPLQRLVGRLSHHYLKLSKNKWFWKSRNAGL